MRPSVAVRALNSSKLNLLRVVTLSISLMSVSSFAADDCSSEIALIDERVAGKPDDQKKQIVLLMRQGLEQMCAHLDADALRQYRENIDKFYPDETDHESARENESLADQLAEKQARAEQRERKKQARLEQKAAELAAKPAPLNSPVINAPPSVKSIAGLHMTRADAMNQLVVHDWDLRNGNLRVLYTTFPDRTQYGLANWRFYIYVVEATPNGAATQTLVTSKQASDHAALALRRGFDEIFLMRHVDRPDEPTFFERWSISKKSRLSSVDMTGIRPAINGVTYRSAQFGVPTSDGNLMFSAMTGLGRGETIRIALFKLSMTGETLAASELPGNTDQMRPWTWFATDNGGAGLVFDYSPSSAAGLTSSDLANLADPDMPENLMPRVILEKRFHLIDERARSAWESGALARTMMFQPRQQNTPGASIPNIQEQLSAQAQANDLAARRYNAGRDINSLNIGAMPHPMIRPMGDGYAALVTQTANRKMFPPVHGQYLVKWNRGGDTREIYLNPLALQMDVKFTAFATGKGDGDFYLLASQAGRRAFVIHSKGDGEPLAYAETASVVNFDLQRAVLISDSSGVWLLGDRWQDNVGKPLLWIERFAFP